MLTIVAGFDAMTLETQENVRLIRDFLPVGGDISPGGREETFLPVGGDISPGGRRHLSRWEGGDIYPGGSRHLSRWEEETNLGISVHLLQEQSFLWLKSFGTVSHFERCRITLTSTKLKIIAGSDRVTPGTQENVNFIREFLHSDEIRNEIRFVSAVSNG